MKRGAAVLSFLRSREGNGWVGILLFAGALAFAGGFGFYQTSLKSFVVSKLNEKLIAMQLADAFVGDYANINQHSSADGRPDPAAFRAQALARFNSEPGQRVMRLEWVDRDGRSTPTTAPDPAMAEAVQTIAASPDHAPVTQFLDVDGEPVFRTVYPSFAGGEITGAFAVDVPVAAYLQGLQRDCIVI